MVEYDFKKINDYEILFLVNEKNENAEEILINKYKNLINKYIEEYKNIAVQNGLEECDLYQEGLLGLTNAIKTFDQSKEASFFTYANICIKTKIQTAIRNSSSKKNIALNQSVSLDNLINSDSTNYYDIICDSKNDISDKLLKQEEQQQLFQNIEKCLTPFEKQVLNLKTNSYSNDEIANILQKDKRSIENAINRIRNKYRNIKKKKKTHKRLYKIC